MSLPDSGWGEPSSREKSLRKTRRGLIWLVSSTTGQGAGRPARRGQEQGRRSERECGREGRSREDFGFSPARNQNVLKGFELERSDPGSSPAFIIFYSHSVSPFVHKDVGLRETHLRVPLHARAISGPREWGSHCLLPPAGSQTTELKRWQKRVPPTYP